VFDLRYHVASLAAVFLALVLGMIIGAAISDPGLADETSRQQLRDEISRLNRRLEAAESRVEEGRAAEAFVEATYGAVMADRLSGRRILVVSIGAADERVSDATEAVDDADGSVARMLALELPSDDEPIDGALDGRSSLSGYLGRDNLFDLGRDFGRELVDGGETPLLDALSPVLVGQRRGSDARPVDGVVLVRPAKPQGGPLAAFVRGVYAGLAGATTTVGAEVSGAQRSAVLAFDRAGLATVDNVDTNPGKLALAVLLETGAGGNFGLEGERILPPVEPVEPERPAGA
jgi:Copper transport outer membrane protein, MctB